MGVAVAQAALDRGARVTIVAANVEVELPDDADVVRAESTADLRTATARFATLDYSDARPRLYTGEVVELAALAPRGLRELEGSR